MSGTERRADARDGEGGGLDLTAIVVSYNSEGRIGDAVRAHNEALAGLAFEVIVVDNDSGDRSVEEARQAITSGEVVANQDNVGYGHAANQAIRMARGRHCLILNDDARIDADSVRLLRSVLESDDRVALVGPRIVDEEGEPMPSARLSYPGLAEEVSRFRDVLRGENANAQYPIVGEEPTDVAWLVAACVIGDTEILRRTGGFNPAFFLYSEDIDLARRLVDQDYRVVSVPGAVCVHTGSVSTTETFGQSASSKRRTDARDLYYRIWLSRLERSVVHLRRAIGFKNQPSRLIHHLPRVVWDGKSRPDLRRPEPLTNE